MHTTLSDEALMTEITAKRNNLAFAELYERWSARIYRYFLRMQRRNAAKAEDMTQDLFIKIIEKPHLFDSNRRFSTWVYTIAANMCKNEYRRQSIEETVHSYPEISGGDEALRLPEWLDRQKTEQQIQQAIDHLDEHHRPCFVLRWQEDLSLRDISEIVGCPEGTVKSRLHYALKQVSEKVKSFEKQPITTI